MIREGTIQCIQFNTMVKKLTLIGFVLCDRNKVFGSFGCGQINLLP